MVDSVMFLQTPLPLPRNCEEHLREVTKKRNLIKKTNKYADMETSSNNGGKEDDAVMDSAKLLLDTTRKMSPDSLSDSTRLFLKETLAQVQLWLN